MSFFLYVDEFVHSWFIGLGNSLEVVIYCLLIGDMTCLNHWNRFYVVNILVCIRSKESHD